MNIGKDKILHFLVNFTCSFLFGIYGVALGVGLSAGKEYGDYKAVNNKWDWYDILADGIGLFVGYLLHLLMKYILIND